jgi:hypothetical protein
MPPPAQPLYVCNSTPNSPCPCQASTLVVYGAAFPAGSGVTVSGSSYSFSATNTGTSQNDENGVPRPVVQLVCVGGSGGGGAGTISIGFDTPSSGPFSVKVFRYEVIDD